MKGSKKRTSDLGQIGALIVFGNSWYHCICYLVLTELVHLRSPEKFRRDSEQIQQDRKFAVFIDH